MAVSAHTQHDGIDQAQEALVILGQRDIPLTERNRGESKVAAAARHRVQLQFERLEALLQLAKQNLIGVLTGNVFIQTQFILRIPKSLIPGLVSVGQKNLIQFS